MCRAASAERIKGSITTTPPRRSIVHPVGLLLGGGLVVAACAAADAAGAWPAEPSYVRLLRLGVAAAAAALVAEMLILAPSGSDSIEREPNNDPSLVWHEEKGVTKLVPRVPPAIERRGSLPKYTLADVATHCTLQDLWVVIDARAYDLTQFAKAHPGGMGPLANMAGRDCTDVFHNYHSARVYQHLLPKFLVGEVTDVVTHEHVKDFRHIRQELLRRGLFETDARSYVKLGTWLLLLFLAVLHALRAWHRREGCQGVCARQRHGRTPRVQGVWRRADPGGAHRCGEVAAGTAASASLAKFCTLCRCSGAADYYAD